MDNVITSESESEDKVSDGEQRAKNFLSEDLKKVF